MWELPLDIWQIILEYSDFMSQIRLRMISHLLTNLRIINLYNIDVKIIKKLTDEILSQYPYVKYLDASYSQQITTVNHMKCLIKLHSGCGITDEGIKNVNLHEFLTSSLK